MVTESPDPESDCIELRIQLRDGFTRRLLERSWTLASNKTETAFIKGPYGLPYEFSEFGTVVMFASSIGIAGYLSYIKEILRHHQQLDTKTRDILLIWHLDIKEQLDLVAPFFNDILKKDKISVKGERSIVASDTADLPGMRPAPSGENASSRSRTFCYG
jgi:hypothetical protein